MGWSVYKHTIPDGKVYIGISSKDPVQRWNNGFGYQTQLKFFKEIVRYGWDNITHEIIETNLTETDARELEKTLIKAEQTNTLNTQLREGYSISCKNTLIEDGDNEVRKRKFREYADYWIDKARYRDTPPFYWEIYPYYMDLTYYTCEQDIVYLDIFRVILPPKLTYQELYDYLTWKYDFSTSEHIKSEKLGELSQFTLENRVAEIGA